MQNSFTPRQSSAHLQFIPPPSLQNPWQLRIFSLCLYNFAFYRMTPSWNEQNVAFEKIINRLIESRFRFTATFSKRYNAICRSCIIERYTETCMTLWTNEPYGDSVSSFVRKHQPAFQSGNTILRSHQQWMRVLLLHILFFLNNKSNLYYVNKKNKESSLILGTKLTNLFWYFIKFIGVTGS